MKKNRNYFFWKKKHYSVYMFFYKRNSFFQKYFTTTGKTLLGITFMATLFSIDPQISFLYQFSILGFFLFLVSFIFVFINQKKELNIELEPPECLNQNIEHIFKLNTSHKNISYKFKIITKPPSFREFLRLKNVSISAKSWSQYIDKQLNFYQKPLPNNELSIYTNSRGFVSFYLLVGLNDPLGIVTRYKQQKQINHLYILPKIYKIRFSKNYGNTQSDPLFNNNQQIGESFDVKNLREYIPGDALKKIHWKNSSKYNQLIVKEFDEETSSRTAIILDVYTKKEEFFEEAVSVAASFVLSDYYQDVEAIIAGQDYICGNGHLQKEQILKILCTISQQRGNLNQTKEIILKEAAELKSCIFIFNEFTEKQKDFISFLKNNNILVLPFLISTEKNLEISVINPLDIQKNLEIVL